MLYPKHAKTIISLKNNDLFLRNQLIKNGKLNDGYVNEMEELHIKNEEKLEKIIDKIGFPDKEKVGEEGYDATWLVIQHAISKPKFMKKCAKLLKNVIKKKQASVIHLAYLEDRIAVLEDKPQLYGTQFDWDENGQLSPNLYDKLKKANQRRLSIGLNTLEEQIEIIRKISENEKQKEYNLWREKVGWKKIMI